MIRKKLLLLLFVLSLIGCTKDSTPSTKAPNLKTTGASASDLLSDDYYTSLHLEIAYVEGYKPSDQALSILSNFFQKRIYKPDGITMEMHSVASSGKSPFSIEEIADIEKKQRTKYNSGDEIVVWIYFADGKDEKDDNEKRTLGSAFRNTSIVIYEKSIKDFSNQIGAPPKEILEATTLEHEFCHLFGLVDLGAPLLSNHQDPENEHHCATAGCLMNAELEFGSGIADVINDSSVPDLKQACINDLRAAGGK
ncbi:hypothetical protein C7S20_10940 [Christiangramia fulva]|uniref:Membrane metalloprotease n=1 Tax=Christiangramia fulva TaxID=2126553 RepID=A0A2R3Z657_9FLAO|nr:hypothetical protein [Christiangramia fulva]AVR45728.1 hypothetical protein C7S20_10940 [Christiangramia fulva]